MTTLDSHPGRARRRCVVGNRGIPDIVRPGCGDLSVGQPGEGLGLGGSLRGGPGLVACHLGQPDVVGRHRPQRFTRRLGQPGGQAGIEPGDGEIPLVAALVAGEWIDRHPEQAPFAPHRLEESLIGGPDAGEPTLLHGDAFLGAGVAHHRDTERGVDEGVRLDVRPLGIGLKQRYARSQPGGDCPFRKEQGHPAGPVAAAAMAPEGPGGSRQFRMPRRLPQFGQGPLKGLGRAVAGVAPHLTVGFLRLLVRRREQRTIVLGSQRLPVEVVGTGQARRARPLTAAVLVNDDAPQPFDLGGNPDRVADRKDQLARFGRGLVANPVIRRLDRGKDIVGWLLGQQRRGEQQAERNDGANLKTDEHLWLPQP